MPDPKTVQGAFANARSRYLTMTAHDFSVSRFELQVKYNTGWLTIDAPSPFDASIELERALRRWPSLKVRLLQDGKAAKRHELRNVIVRASYGRSR